MKKNIKEWLDKTDPEGLSNKDGCFMAAWSLTVIIITVSILVLCSCN
jgi:hypothetical protein